LALGLAERHLVGDDQPTEVTAPPEVKKPKKRAPNQFLILIYNLLLADMHQAAAFLLNGVWLNNDAILVGTPTCFVQGWLVSTGDLSSSLFISAIAIHTYMSIVLRRQPSQKVLYGGIIGIWLFVYIISIAPIAATSNGENAGGYYVRAVAWVSLYIMMGPRGGRELTVDLVLGQHSI
jgi:hypothetical protein